MASLAQPLITDTFSTSVPSSTSSPMTTSTPVTGRLDLRTKTLSIPIEWYSGSTTTVPLTYPAAPVTTTPPVVGPSSDVYDIPVQLYPGSTTLLRVTVPDYADFPATHNPLSSLITAPFNVPPAPSPTSPSTASTSVTASLVSSAETTPAARSSASANATAPDQEGNNPEGPALLRVAMQHQSLEIGLSIGLGLLALIVFALLFWFWQRRKNKKPRLGDKPIPLFDQGMPGVYSPQSHRKKLSTSTTSSSSFLQKPGQWNSYSMFGINLDPTRTSRQRNKASDPNTGQISNRDGPGSGKRQTRSPPQQQAQQQASSSGFPEYKGKAPLISLSKAQRLDYMRRNPNLWQTPHNDHRSSFVPTTPILDPSKVPTSNRTTFTPRLGVRNRVTKPDTPKSAPGKGLGIYQPRPRTDSTTCFLGLSSSSRHFGSPGPSIVAKPQPKNRDKETWLALFGKYPSSEDVSVMGAADRSDDGWRLRKQSRIPYPPSAYRRPPQSGNLVPQPLRRRRSDSDWSIATTERERIIDLYAAMPQDSDDRDDLTEADIESVRAASRTAESEIQPHTELQRYLQMQMAPIWG